MAQSLICVSVPWLLLTIIQLPGLLLSETGSLLEDLDFNILILVFYSLSLLTFHKEQFSRVLFGEQSRRKEFSVEVIRKKHGTRCLCPKVVCH